METVHLTATERNLSTAIHLSTFTKWIIPFGNVIFPLILWMAGNQDSQFTAHHGKQALNFQLSMMLYGFALILMIIPLFFFGLWDSLSIHSLHEMERQLEDMPIGTWFHWGTWLIPVIVLVFLGIVLWLADVAFTLVAAVQAKEGKLYRYPLCIQFLK